MYYINDITNIAYLYINNILYKYMINDIDMKY